MVSGTGNTEKVKGPVGPATAESPPPEEAPELEADERVPGAYEAVVYFHGMGDQRRYVEIGRLIDAFDQFAQPERRPAKSPGLIRRLEGRFDEPRADQEQLVIGHAELQHDHIASRGRFRFYEAYWAPEAAKGVPVRDVVMWLAKNLFRPMGVLAARWRSHLRLRGTFLDHAVHDEELRDSLAIGYWDFTGAEARRIYRHGSFREFKEYLRTMKKQPDAVIKAAMKWRRTIVNRGVQYQVILISLALAVVLVLLAATIAVMWGLVLLGSRSSIGDFLGDMAEPSWTNAWALASAILLALGLQRFLSRSLGDVVFWETNETDDRHEVRTEMLEVGISTLRQVLEDERCYRVVVVAHSLGTPVAYESLLELGRYNKALNRSDPGGGPLPIEKLDQFITLGSPLDKLHYFFESHRGGGHAYTRLVERLHGDIGEVPFTRNRHPHIHWINIWDKADVISGPLSSPNRLVPEGQMKAVQNVEVATAWIPDPAMSHSGYFGDIRVVERLFDTVFFGTYTYAHPPRLGTGAYPNRPDYDRQAIGDIGSSWLTRPFQAVAVLLPWLIGLVWVEAATAWDSPFVVDVRRVILVLGVVMVALVIAGRVAGLRRPITPPAGKRTGSGPQEGEET